MTKKKCRHQKEGENMKKKKKKKTNSELVLDLVRKSRGRLKTGRNCVYKSVKDYDRKDMKKKLRDELKSD